MSGSGLVVLKKACSGAESNCYGHSYWSLVFWCMQMVGGCGAVSCTSVLVHTGVYNEELHDDSCEHTPRDFLPVEVGLKEPTFRVDNILSAVDLIFDREGFS
ncbi:hypothetical protein HPB48_003272 [Haemaphysalis longicornis]|uniref:Uncharacterized protein n=1 Tax=Haemaphysalis longicornis TaxID=44386 RepID=A0A9J6H1U0_HAELO|nr:hypothetical protein HPB48_003272 [Haemaphysalis longicornis]